MSPNRTPLCVIGGGNMAQAIVRGGLDAGVVEAPQVVVAEPDAKTRTLWTGWGVRAVRSAVEAMTDLPPAAQILLAVKPQVFAGAPELAGLLKAEDRVVMSIMAGVTTARVRDRLGPGARVVRLMPNTPARIRKGITAITPGAGTRDRDDTFARSLFAAVGEVVDIDESLMDAFTGVAGSGPAYVYYLAEGMIRGAIEVGLAPDVADRVVRATIAGAAALLHDADESPEALRAMVTSKGGTTAAAVSVQDERGVMDAIVHAIVAARDRGRELAG